MKNQHRYRGQTAGTFFAEDVNELVELRARQRTFNGAYSRGALSIMGYALVILKLFDSSFYRVGLLYAVLAMLFFAVSYMRSRHSRHDFADQHREHGAAVAAIWTVGTEHSRIFGRPYKTAGWIVIIVTCIVACTEAIMLSLLLEL